MIDLALRRLPPEALRWRCDPERFTFQCTDELTPLQEFIGQDRAIRALDFGLAVDKAGYNIFVTGLTGTGKASAIKAYIQRAIEARRQKGERFHPHDWCYLYNFSEPDRPQALRLPRGQGRGFRSRLEELLRFVKEQVPKVFSGEEYDKQRKALVEGGRSRQQELFQSLTRQAREAGFIVEAGPAGVALFPITDGRPISQEEFTRLSPEHRSALEAKQAELMKVVEETFEQVRRVEMETREKLKQLDTQVGQASLTPPFDQLIAQYKEQPEAYRFLQELKSFTLENIELFREQEAKTPFPVEMPRPRERDPFLPFQVNVFVDNSASEAPPIVIEPNPTFPNMFGKLERRAYMGTYMVDHTMLKPGAVHLADDGYLILNARDLFLHPGVWEGLKRLIHTKEARVEDPFEALGFGLAPQGLRPQPIPVEVKVIISGDPMIYHLLSRLDEDFWEMFKVKADFDYQIERTEDNLQVYACFISACCQHESLLPFDRSGVARVVEYAARLVADQQKLSTRFGILKDVMVEADYWARKDSGSRVTGEHVDRAIEEKVFRSNLVAERIKQLIAEGTLMVDVKGEVMGQVNGLAVYDLGDITFGRPSRITARTYMGRRGVINIERESQLSGHIHDKGVLILSGYLGDKYAQDKPLTLSASVCFEQSYEGVEGDSASSTELYAILSCLSGLPVKQGTAITGSVNQKGEVQPIGGVNQKIEGFFEVCQAIGLTGEQGVLIPHQNQRNLMLQEEVVQAVAQGKFHIYPVKTIDEGMEVLTGTPTGERGPDGQYPEGTVNYLVDKRLKELAQGLKGFAGEGTGGG